MAEGTAGSPMHHAVRPNSGNAVVKPQMPQPQHDASWCLNQPRFPYCYTMAQVAAHGARVYATGHLT